MLRIQLDFLLQQTFLKQQKKHTHTQKKNRFLFFLTGIPVPERSIPVCQGKYIFQEKRILSQRTEQENAMVGHGKN